ncbi:MAG: tRNA (guanosine(37)-N1)-methyltransferase TrmD, partial [Pseudomonadota bacterium]
VDAALRSVHEDRLGKIGSLGSGGKAPGRVGDLPAFVLSPRGRRFDQNLATELAEGPGVVLLCGRYEGIDQRVIDAWALEELSVGDFVLSGGEPAALCVLDAVVRLLPGVMGNLASGGEESFSERSETGPLLEYPHYTRPAIWRDGQGVDRAVPEVLTSGHHGKVQAWRDAEALRITRARRPDLLTASGD